MSNSSEQEILRQYSELSQQKILSSKKDLAAGEQAHPVMIDWCYNHQGIVVLENSNILTSKPGSREVQNCKITMKNKGITPEKVLPATSELIRLLISQSFDSSVQAKMTQDVSEQQQRLRSLVNEAIAQEASDIHLEVRKNIARIRFRTHGELTLYAEWMPKLGREIAAVAFNKETDHSASHFNPRVPQNASMPLIIEGREVRLRLASLPTHGGFDVVMRVLTSSREDVPPLPKLGYSTKQIELIHKAISMPCGSIILAGPTGSGKTTTMASLMRLIKESRKIYTIEDPIEKIIKNASQVPVNTELDDRTFASMARTSLRMDPDVIALGEMRDEDTAAVMVRAAITGHLVLSTLHTNSAMEITTRLTNLGIASKLLASPNLLSCLICQRLAAKLCQHCRVPLLESAEHHRYSHRWQLSFPDDIDHIYARGPGCDHCKYQGIEGRTVVAEIIWVDNMGRQFIQTGDLIGWQTYLEKHGWKSMRDSVLDLVKNGLCDPLDAEKLVGEIHPDLQRNVFRYDT